MKIGIDLDNTILDMMPGWLNDYNTAWGDNLTIEDITSFDIKSFCKGGKCIFDYLTPYVILNSLIMKDAREVIERLHSEHDIYIVSASYPNHVVAKYEWIQRELPFLDTNNIIITYSKHLLTLDVLIDDGLHNLEGDVMYVPIVYDQPWNRSNKELMRAYGWNDVELLVKKAYWIKNYPVRRVLHG